MRSLLSEVFQQEDNIYEKIYLYFIGSCLDFWRVYGISIPEKTIVFDYNDSAYQLNTKKLLHKKITVDGYDKIAQVTPTDNGFFCFAENSNGKFFVRVKNSATDFVKIPGNDILYVEDMCFVNDDLFALCICQNDDGSSSLGKIYKADFDNNTLLPLSAGQKNIDIKKLFSLDNRLFVYSIDAEDNRAVSEYKDGNLLFLTSGSIPLTVDETSFLFLNENDKTMQYDINKNSSFETQYRLDITDYESDVFNSCYDIKDGYCVGYKPGFPIKGASNLIGGVTVLNIENGKEYTVFSFLKGRNMQHFKFF